MYRVKLQDFEGPLDLLLFFIKCDELDIYNIPIASLAKEFLEYVRLMEVLDLDVAGEFIVMACDLMKIKVRMLLPASEGEEEETEDPRADLIRRLLEYKKYKELAGDLSRSERKQSRVFYRQNFQRDPRLAPVEDDSTLLRNVTIFDLMSAFKRALDQMPKKTVHEVQRVPVTIEEMAEHVLGSLNERPRLTFLEIVAGMTERIRIVVTFVALLELIKSGMIELQQEEVFGEIWVARASGRAALPQFEEMGYAG